MSLQYVDATNYPETDVPYPGWIADFVALGFTPVGRIMATQGDAAKDEDIRTMYGPEYEDGIRRWGDGPTPVLAAPDGSAFVDISWFFDSPSIRIRSVLSDGSLVETLRRWDHSPPVPTSIRGRNITVDVDSEMLKSDTPAGGRSIRTLVTDSAHDLWEYHLGHLAEYSSLGNTQPVQHRSLAYFLQLCSRVYEHDRECSFLVGRGLRRVLLPAVLLLLALGVALAFLLVRVLGQPAAAPLLITAAMGINFALGRYHPHLVYTPMPKLLRPRFRMDVSGATG